jgi:hypothetical protein
MPTVETPAKVQPAAIVDDWQRPMRGIKKVGKALPSEGLVLRGSHSPNERKKPMPRPNYEAIERRQKRAAR